MDAATRSFIPWHIFAAGIVSATFT